VNRLAGSSPRHSSWVYTSESTGPGNWVRSHATARTRERKVGARHNEDDVQIAPDAPVASGLGAEIADADELRPDPSRLIGPQAKS